MLRQSNRMLYQQSDALDIFIADSASIMFAKTNGSTVRLIPFAFDTFIPDFSKIMFAKTNESTVG